MLPSLLAIDGRSSSGRPTLAARIVAALPAAAVVPHRTWENADIVVSGVDS